MSHQGKTQITFVFTVGPDQVQEGDRIFASHAEWMEQTHDREGGLALLRYNVVKGPELSNQLDPSSEPTANTCFVLSEVYETPAGLADHWEKAGSWKDFKPSSRGRATPRSPLCMAPRSSTRSGSPQTPKRTQRRRRRMLLLAMRGDQGRVDVEDHHITEVGVGDHRRRQRR